MLARSTVFAILLFAAGAANAAPARDAQAFTDYVIERLKPHVKEGETFSSPAPLKLKVTGKRRTVNAGLENLYAVCVQKPDACDQEIDGYVVRWTDFIGPPPVPDISKLYAQLWLDSGMAFLEQIGTVGNNPVAARYAGDLWAVCINGTRPLTKDELSDMGLKEADVVVRCQQNTITAQPPFDAYIQDVPKGGIGKLSGSNQATLLLAHDLWAPIARRFDGELIVCASNTDVVYYGHGADPASLAAMVARVKHDEADRFTASNLMGMKGDPRDVRVKILKWTESGWQVVS